MIATIIKPHGYRGHHKLSVALRRGSVIEITPLKSEVPHFEEARKEAQDLYPNATIIIPRLGEKV